MRSLFIVQSVFLMLVFGLMGCGTSNNSEEVVNGEPKITNDSKQIGDFKVSINVENGKKELNVYATITYMGEETEKDILHGGSIFFFNVYQQDGDFEYLHIMNKPLLRTTLIRNEPLRVDFKGIEKLRLKPGTYEFESIATFSLNYDDLLGTKIKISVSEIVETE